MKTIVISLCLLFLSIPAMAQDVNYCHDKKSWEEWDVLVEKYPRSANVQMLHALRIGLCKKIENGSISFEVARDAFNKMHEIAIKQAQEEQKKYLEGRSL